MWLFVGGTPTNNSLFVGGTPTNYLLFVGGTPMNSSLFVGDPTVNSLLVEHPTTIFHTSYAFYLNHLTAQVFLCCCVCSDGMFSVNGCWQEVMNS